jgi:8-oxo-dGTP diphosphatase
MYQHIGKGGKRYWGKRGAGVVFTDGERILLLRRKGGGAADHEGKWCIPGGKAEAGELPIDTARRECKEEIGNFEGVRFAQFDEKDGQHVFTVYLFKVDKPFSVHLSEEHDEWEWVRLEGVHKLPLHPEFAQHFPYYLKAIKRKFETNFSEWLCNRLN